ncbi:MAG: aldo/keto reductase [Deltaproteobacteria bacterium]|nr:aldo/keto reductase [Deltaproteobacteria bacterium]
MVDRVAELAGRFNVRPTQIALAWLLHKKDVTAPIIGASKLTYLDEAIAAIDIELSAEDIRYLEELYQPHRILGHS